MKKNLEELCLEARRELEKLEKAVENKRDEYRRLLNRYKEKHALIPENTYAKAEWIRNGRHYKGVVYVTDNRVYENKDGFEVLPVMMLCKPYDKKRDDGSKHYYHECWEHHLRYVAYDSIVSITPYDAPVQTCGRCIWIDCIKRDGVFAMACGINVGYHTCGGNAQACDRFTWWNRERDMGMSHIEYQKSRLKD